MHQIRAWFSRGASLWSVVDHLPAILFAKIILAVVGVGIASALFSPQMVAENGDKVDVLLKEYSPFWQFVLISGFAPAVEEFLFRLVPFAFAFGAIHYAKLEESTLELPLVLATALASSVSFGYMHGPANVLVQGLSSVVTVAVFLKWSAFGTDLLKGWVACVIVHGTFNGVVQLSLITKQWMEPVLRGL